MIAQSKWINKMIKLIIKILTNGENKFKKLKKWMQNMSMNIVKMIDFINIDDVAITNYENFLDDEKLD